MMTQYLSFDNELSPTGSHARNTMQQKSQIENKKSRVPCPRRTSSHFALLDALSVVLNAQKTDQETERLDFVFQKGEIGQ